MNANDTRAKLIRGTISVIARDGLDKATTRSISLETGINETYIYRCFDDKKDMFAAMFKQLDEELLNKVKEHIKVMYISELSYEARCRIYFWRIWEFITESKEEFLAYVMYYYSPYFHRYSSRQHEARVEQFVEIIKGAFKPDADVRLILHHILNVMLGFAMRLFHDGMPNEDDYVEHIFRVIYASIKQYFKEDER